MLYYTRRRNKHFDLNFIFSLDIMIFGKKKRLYKNLNVLYIKELLIIIY
jgi:hypothetical protein